MQLIKRYGWWLPVIMVSLYGVYAYAAPCNRPIGYTYGTFSPKFGLSEAEFKRYVEESASLWNEAVGKTLFVYDPKAKLTVNLIYDDRQAVADKNEILQEKIDEVKNSADVIKQKLDTLQTIHKTNAAAYDQMLAAYQTHQATYNQNVEYWNAQGGAPKVEYNKLVADKNALVKEGDALEVKRLEVNKEVQTINELIGQYNTLIKSTNKNINTINESAGKEFDAGEYKSDRSGERINIYEFTSKTELSRVLTHEFGHALGLGHTTTTDSIMYYLNQSLNTKLTPEDRAAISKLCGLK